MKHIQVTIIEARSERILTSESANSILLHLVSTIGMQKARRNSLVTTYPPHGKSRGGVGLTAFLPFTESAMLLDTYSKQNYLVLIVASCKNFDSEKLKQEFGKLIESSWIKIKTLSLTRLPEDLLAGVN